MEFVWLIFLLFGLQAAIAVFVPRFRLRWKGTSIYSGAITNVGFAMTFTLAGFAKLLFDHGPRAMKAVAAAAFFVGALCVVVGFFSDLRKSGRSFAIPSFSVRDLLHAITLAAVGLALAIYGWHLMKQNPELTRADFEHFAYSGLVACGVILIGLGVLLPLNKQRMSRS